MREYLFRGKRLSDGKWCEGFLTVVFEHTYIGKANEDENCFRFLVDPETVGQFTGMKDRNGKEIFEGDICRVCLDPEICTAHIQYDERTASFNMRYNKFQCNTFLDMRLAENVLGIECGLKSLATSMTTRNYWRDEHERNNSSQVSRTSVP